MPEAAPKVPENEPKTVIYEPERVSNEPISTPFFKIAGVMFNTYVFVELEDKMMIIDKHAAHERVLFEKMRANMSSLEPVSQLRLFPVNVPLTQEEMAACTEYRDELVKLGFDFVEGEKGVDLIQYPSGLNDGQSVTMFSELASRLSDGYGDLKIGRDAFYEKALYQASCKAAVKGGREDSPENIRWIAEQVIVNPNIRFCPHGRPVAFEMTKSEFERQFERT
jgi:DNA mismatch repair protein MutL